MKRVLAYCSLLLALTLTACNNVIYDDEGNCDVVYRLKFVYDKNMKWADAFAHEVHSVRVYVFDSNEQLVWQNIESGEQLASGNYTMTLPLQPGDYHIIAWCGADNNAGNEDFVIADGKTTISNPEEATAYLKREHTADGQAYVQLPQRNMHALYHGEEHYTLEDYSHDGGEYTYVMPLTKDTNTLRVVLQHLSGKPVDVNLFDFEVTDANGSLQHNNLLFPDETITYRPFATYAGVAGVEVRTHAPATRTITDVSIAEAEIAFPRMMVERKRDMRLNIYNKENGDTVVSVPVIDYALLVKGFERENLDDQEYLDRQDEYSMVFFLDESGTWIAATIVINSWRVVLQNQDLQ